MKSLAQFKAENSIDKIQLLQGKGRKYCTVRDLSLVVGEKTDLTKPLFVTEMSTLVDPAKPDGERVVVPKAFILINASTVKCVEEI